MKIKSLLRIINLPFKAFYKLLFPWKNLSKRNQKIVTITSIIVIFIMIPVIYYTLSHLKGASAAWFNDNWGYRQIVAITNAGSAQTDFQISITLDTATLITAGKMRSDCNDIRITDINGRLIPYWIEESPTTNTCNSSTTKIWTKVPSIPTSGASIYLYYGNPSATSVKNGYKTFEQFDDFNRADNTNVGNNWLETDGAGSAEISSNQLKLSITNTTKDGVIAYKPYTTSSAVAMEYSTKNTTLYRAAQGFFVSLSSWTNIYTQEYATLAPYSTVWINKNYYVTGARQEATITSATTDTTNFYRGKVEILGTTDNYSWSLPGTNNFTDTQASVDNYSAVQNFGFTVWNDGSASNLPVSYIDWFSIRKAATTAPSIAAPTNEEKSPAPVAYWKFDEGTGTIANDSSSNKNNGTIAGATWQTNDQCINGKCLKFNGTGDYVNVHNVPDSIFGGNFTVSAWVKFNTVNKGTDNAILGHGTTAGDKGLHLAERSGKAYMGFYGDDLAGNKTLSANTWYFVTFVYDGGKKIYVNGVLDNSGTSNPYTGTGSNAEIGRYPWLTSYLMNGFIDEPKIYSYARTAAQVKTDYSSRGSVKGISAQIGGSDANKNLTNGLVGYWKMDESSANGCTGGVNDNCDSSGNGNDGAWNGNATSATGKYGNGTTFDGIDDYISVTNNTMVDGTNFTLSAWIKQNQSGYGQVMGWHNGGTDGALAFDINGSNPSLHYDTNTGGNHAQNYTSITISPNVWHHYLLTKNGTNLKVYLDGAEIINETDIAADLNVEGFNFKIGDENNLAADYNGQIDETRVYNRALSSSEVSQLYNFAPGPMGYWNFEEGNGNSVNDTSGNANTGTWNGTGSHWTQGKYGKAGNFNGSSDYVGAGTMSISSDITVGAWVYSSNFNQNGFVVGKNTVNTQWELFFEGTNLRWRGGAAENTVVCSLPANNQWHYIVGKQSGTTGELYIDGVSCDTGTLTAIGNGSGNVEIGRFNNAYYFNGKIDDVKVYNYLRTPGQIVSDMNAGHPNVGSPVGSAVGYWKMDEGYGTTANNSGNGGSAISGTLTNMSSPATAVSGWNQDGKFSKSLSFDGTNDYVNVGTSSTLDFTGPMTISAWINITGGAGTFRTVLSRWDSVGGINTRSYFLGVNSSNQVYFVTSSNGSDPGVNNTATDPTIPSTGIWYHYSAVFDGSTMRLYRNGIQVATSTQTAIKSSPNNQVGIGAVLGRSGDAISAPFNGKIDEVKIYNAALTASEIKLDYNHGATQVLGSTSTEETPKSLSGLTFWLDADAPSTIAQATGVSQWSDKSASNNNVVQATGSKQPSYVQNILNGKPVVRFTAASSQTMTTSTNFASPVSVIYVSRQTGGGNSRMLSGLANNWLLGYWNGCHQQAYFEGWVTSSCGTPASTTSWYIQSVVETGSLSTYYEDGTQIASNANGVAGPNGFSLNGYLGTSEFSNGDIAEIVVYNRALSTAEREKIEGYLANKWGLMGNLPASHSYKNSAPSMVSNSNSSAYCIPGDTATCSAPVGEWNFEEGSGTSANDSSGNGRTGTLGRSSWSSGKFGKAASFDGTNDYVGIPTIDLSASSAMTIEAWIKPTNITTNTYYEITRQDAGGLDWLLSFQDNGTILSFGLNAGGTYTEIDVSITASTYTDGKWHHIAATYDGTTRRLYKDGVQIGSVGDSGAISFAGLTNCIGGYSYGCAAERFNGKIDQVRIFNYGRTPAQVTWDYNKGTPVGYWKMDECEGAIAHDAAFDAARGGNNGTLTIGATGTQTSAGTCTTSGTAWGNGATGKYNSSLNFDGTDDVIDAGNNSIFNFTSSDFSISLWVKSADGAGNETLLQRGLTQVDGWTIMADPYVHLLTHQSGAYTYCRSQHPVIAGQWQHWVAVRQGSNVRLYKNGLEDIPYTGGTCTSISNPVTSTRSLTIGNGSWGYFNGQLDDARIYNYALTKQQIQQVYNQGAAVRFGPLTGSP